jgi:hypothetical protein
MAEPLLLRPWEIANLTDRQIRVMVAAQTRVTESVKGGDGPKADEPYVPPIDLGPGEFVTPERAAEFMTAVDREILQS